MIEPYKLKTAIAPRPISRDEVAEYFEQMEQRRAVNPRHKNPRIMKR